MDESLAQIESDFNEASELLDLETLNRAQISRLCKLGGLHGTLQLPKCDGEENGQKCWKVENVKMWIGKMAKRKM